MCLAKEKIEPLKHTKIGTKQLKKNIFEGSRSKKIIYTQKLYIHLDLQSTPLHPYLTNVLWGY